MFMGKATILVADDEEIITRVLESEFVRAGYNVAIANDGEDAWRKIQDRVFDAAILDVRMPKKNGIELLKEIMRRNSKTAVIIMTAFGTIRDAVEAVKIGAYDYVTKPFDNDALLSKVSQALRVQEVKAEHYVAATESYGLVGDSEEVRRLKEKIQK